MSIQHKRTEIIRWTALLVLPLILAFAGVSLAGWDDYKPAKLTDSIAKHAHEFKDTDLPKNAVKIHIHPGDPLRVTVRYLGKRRDLKPKRGMFISDMWGKALGKDREMLARTYQKEIQVEENGRTYWLPIQNILLEPLEKEVGKNGTVELWVAFIGSIEEDLVFLVNEFQAQ